MSKDYSSNIKDTIDLVASAIYYDTSDYLTDLVKQASTYEELVDLRNKVVNKLETSFDMDQEVAERSFDTFLTTNFPNLQELMLGVVQLKGDEPEASKDYRWEDNEAERHKLAKKQIKLTPKKSDDKKKNDKKNHRDSEGLKEVTNAANIPSNNTITLDILSTAGGYQKKKKIKGKR